MTNSPVSVVRAWMAGIQADIDDTLTDWAVRRPSEPISCLTCTLHGCCKQQVMVGFYEGVLIADHLAKTGRDTPKLRKTLRASARAQDGLSHSEWFEDNRSCVFIADGRCSIYDVRPAVCRGHFVITPPDDCDGDGRVNYLSITHAISDRCSEFYQGLAPLMGLDPGAALYFGRLPRVVLRMLKAREAKTWGHWAKRVIRQGWPKTVEEVAALPLPPMVAE